MLTKTLRKKLLQFWNAELSPPEFESWICSADVEEALGKTTYLDLISADYRGRGASAMREVCERLLEQHHPGEAKRYRVVQVLHSMLTDDDGLLDGLTMLARLHHQGYDDLIPIEFIGFESETDSIPRSKSYHLWEPSALADLLAREVPYRAQIRAASEELLHELRHRFPDDV